MSSDKIAFSPFTGTDLANLPGIQPTGWPDIAPYFNFYLAVDYCHPFRITSGNEFIGTGSVILHRHTAWIAHIIVREDFRRQGIGERITRHLMEVAEAYKPRTISLVATPMGEPLYAKIGFHKQAEYSFFRDGATPPPDGSHLRPAIEKDYSYVLHLDKIASGEDRSALIRDHLTNAIVYDTGHGAAGAYFPSLTEGYIVADNEEAGIELMKQKYQHGIPHAILPSENLAGIGLLKNSGATQFRTAARMYVGEKINWHPTKIFSRIGGYLG